MNLYGFVGNDGTNDWDILGMWKYLKRDREKAWATICAEEGDKWKDLADKLKLESQDAQKWVRNYEAVPKGGTSYQVPNVSVFFSNISWDDANLAIYAVTTDLLNMARYDSERGYKTEWVHSDDPEEFKSKWQVEGIYRFYFAGHGAPYIRRTWYGRDIIESWMGLIIDNTHKDTSTLAVVSSSEVAPKYKLRMVSLYACGSADMGWQTHVSNNGGLFIGYHGNTWIGNCMSTLAIEIYHGIN